MMTDDSGGHHHHHHDHPHPHPHHHHHQMALDTRQQMELNTNHQGEAALITDANGQIADDTDERVIINVGGVRHETLISTLLTMPGTRLGNIGKKHVKGRGPREYFFDRHPGVFGAVMDYLRSGELHVPLDVCGAVVKRELNFWQIEQNQIEPCCWISYSSYIDNLNTLADFNASVAQEEAQMEHFRSLTGKKKRRMEIWMVLDHPRSSRLALVYAVTSFVFVLASIAGFTLETIPDMHSEILIGNDSECRDETIAGPQYMTKPATFLVVLDYVCTAFFTVELIIRIVFAPNKIQFFRSPMNIIDILALLPLYVQIILDKTDEYNCLRSDRAVVETIFVLRIIRIFRIFHLVKHYRALKILIHAIKASIQELLMLCIFLVIAMLVFSTLIFYAERSPEDKSLVSTDDAMDEDEEKGKFKTIPIGFWWATITMTTVGYGDVYPKTPGGMCIGALCAVWGVLLLALTIPVISNNFALFYMHARTRETIASKNRTIEKSEEDIGNTVRSRTPSGVHHHEKNNKHVTGLDSKALLAYPDSISTTEESGLMMASKDLEGDSANSTPRKLNNTHDSSETAM